MLQFDWQSILVVLALAGSAAYLIRCAIRALRSEGRQARGCSSCSACPSTQAHAGAAPANLVTLAPTFDSSAESKSPRPGERGT